MRKFVILLVLFLTSVTQGLSTVSSIVDPDNGVDTDYTSLDAWEDAIGGTTSGNLPSDDQIAQALCRSSSGTDDTTVVDVTGWTTDATRYIEIKGSDFPSDGILDTSKYVLTGTNANVLTIRENYVRVTNLQIVGTQSAAGTVRTIAVVQVAASDIRVDSCILKGICSGTGAGVGISVNDNQATIKIWNTIIYDFYISADTGFRGIESVACSAMDIYNCTVFSNTIGIAGPGGTVTATNCAVFNHDAGNDFDGTITIDYCASDDGDGTNAEDFTAEATDWNKVFTEYDAANPDVSLLNYTTNPCCVGEGTDNPGSGLYSDDILDESRVSVWDIGAFEYIAAAGAGSMVLEGSILEPSIFGGVVK